MYEISKVFHIPWNTALKVHQKLDVYIDLVFYLKVKIINI